MDKQVPEGAVAMLKEIHEEEQLCVHPDISSHPKSTNSPSLRHGLMTHAPSAPFLTLVAIGVVIGGIIIGLGWNAASHRADANEAKLRTAIAERDVAVAEAGETAAAREAEAADAAKAKMATLGAIQGFIGAAEAHSADGNFTEAGDLISGLMDLHSSVGDDTGFGEETRGRLETAEQDLLRRLMLDRGFTPESVDMAISALTRHNEQDKN